MFLGDIQPQVHWYIVVQTKNFIFILVIGINSDSSNTKKNETQSAATNASLQELLIKTIEMFHSA